MNFLGIVGNFLESLQAAEGRFLLKVPQICVRSTKALPSLFLRTKVGAKSVQSRWGRGGASSLVRRMSGGRAEKGRTFKRKDAKTLSLIFLNTDRTD